MNFQIKGYKLTGHIRNNNNPPEQKINNNLSNKLQIPELLQNMLILFS